MARDTCPPPRVRPRGMRFGACSGGHAPACRASRLHCVTLFAALFVGAIVARSRAPALQNGDRGERLPFTVYRLPFTVAPNHGRTLGMPLMPETLSLRMQETSMRMLV